MLWHESSCRYDCVCHVNTSNRSGKQRCSVQYFSLYCNLQATARCIACVWTQAWLNQTILRKPLSFMLFETPKCVCLCAPLWSLFLHVKHCLPCCAALCRARGNHNDGGFKTLCSCWESLERFFSFRLLSHCLFFPSLLLLSYCSLFLIPLQSPSRPHTFFSHFSYYKCRLLRQLNLTWLAACRCVCTWTQKLWELYHLEISN